MVDDFGDWRIAAVTTLAKDLPAAFPGGPSHKAGAAVYQSCLVQTAEGANISFVLPGATAMALNIAIRGGKDAAELKSKIQYKMSITPNGPGNAVSDDSTAVLYDFFEQCMIAVTFSYQALEVFCNHIIARELKEPLKFKRGRKWLSLSPAEIERQRSTEEKLTLVLPRLRKIASPKGKRPWEAFKELKKARDATIHLKSRDQYPGDRESLFFEFLSRDPTSFARSAAEMIRYFPADPSPRWLNLLPI